jgi:hypothetical protein
VKICVPRYSAPGTREESYRQAAWEQCSRYWNRLGYEVVEGQGESRAAARNAAAKLVTDQDVLIFADSDTVVPAHQLVGAIERADGMVLPYTTLYRALRNHPPLDQLLSRPRGYQVRDCSNGVLVVSRALWEELGGFDERFRVWGGEDRAFMYAAEVLGEVTRLQGHAVHLWHPPDRVAQRPSLEYRSQLRLAMRYKQAAGREARDGPLASTRGAVRDRQVIEALLREPGGPRS